jgi:aryl-alcohol dehydrogenase-like predicted oxidoreductase
MTEAVAVPVTSLPGGVEMPMIGFGTSRLRGLGGREAVAAALAAGYRHIDTATMYGNESEVGRALADSGLSRESVFITTKLVVHPPGGSTPQWLNPGWLIPGDSSPVIRSGICTSLTGDVDTVTGGRQDCAKDYW